MKKATYLATLISLLITGCTPPKATTAMPLIDIGDPMGTKDSPMMVPFKTIRKIHQPSAPNYPAGAKANGIHGDVLVEVWINDEGIPIKSAALFGPKELLQCAADYILKWKFAPYLSNNKSIPVRFRMVMPFQLREGGPYKTLPKELIY